MSAFAYWVEGPPCNPRTSGHSRKDEAVADQVQKKRKTDEEAISRWKAEAVAAKLTEKMPDNFVARTPTKEDEHELVKLNKAPFEIRAIPSLGRAPVIWAIPSQGREDLVHKPTSDLDHSLPGVGVHGAGRSIGLFGHSFPDPDVLANKSGNIPGPNADETFSSRTASETTKSKQVLKQCRKEDANSDEYEIELEDEDET